VLDRLVHSAHRLELRAESLRKLRAAVASSNLTLFVVELTVPDGWPIHITWAAMALGVMACGPGRLSAGDHILGRMLGTNLTVTAFSKQHPVVATSQHSVHVLD
jgi:hypothetical protein